MKWQAPKPLPGQQQQQERQGNFQQQDQQQHPRHIDQKELAREQIQHAQKRAPKFEREPFNPKKDISYFETTRLTPERNFHGHFEERSEAYFDFPVPSWAAHSKQKRHNHLLEPDENYQATKFPKGILSTLNQCKTGNQNEEEDANNNRQEQVGRDLSAFPDFNFAAGGGSGNGKTGADGGEIDLSSILGDNNQNTNNNQNSNNGTISKSFYMKSYLDLLGECEERERQAILDHEQDITLQVLIEADKELDHKIIRESERSESETSASLLALRRKRAATMAASSSPKKSSWDRALRNHVGSRMDLMGQAALDLAVAVVEEFDPTSGGIYALYRNESDSRSSSVNSQTGGRNNNNKGEGDSKKVANKEKDREISDLEARIAELESNLSWSKFEKKRLDDLLKKETAESAANRASRDAAMQQLAALESECIPLLQGMKEIFGNESSTSAGRPNNNSKHNNSSGLVVGGLNENSALGSLLGTPNGKATATALERVAAQVESPLLSRFPAMGTTAATGTGNASSSSSSSPTTANANSAAAAASGGEEGVNQSPSKRNSIPQELSKLDAETLASMILLERKLAERMLVGAQSQVMLEVESQKRFVDVNIIMKKQHLHSMFLAELFQHKLPNLRRACSALGNVVHKFESSCVTHAHGTSGAVDRLRHKSNVVSRHNPGCSSTSLTTTNTTTATSTSSGGGQMNVTHSALVAYSKSLVAHVAALVRWLDCEVSSQERQQH